MDGDETELVPARVAALVRADERARLKAALLRLGTVPAKRAAATILETSDNPRPLGFVAHELEPDCTGSPSFPHTERCRAVSSTLRSIVRSEQRHVAAHLRLHGFEVFAAKIRRMFEKGRLEREPAAMTPERLAEVVAEFGKLGIGFPYHLAERLNVNPRALKRMMPGTRPDQLTAIRGELARRIEASLAEEIDRRAALVAGNERNSA